MPTGASERSDSRALYSGSAGYDYHQKRVSSRTDEGQRARARYFSGFTSATDTVLDFGCATGGVLASMPAAKRVGIEVNEFSGAEAKTRLDEVHTSLGAVGAGTVDRIVSFHAMEHVHNPFEIMSEMRRVLKPGGRMRIITPYDNIVFNAQHRAWSANDRDMHLFCWTPLHMGNLLTVAGFNVREAVLSPWSEGGRVARLFRWSPPVVRAARWFKATTRGLLQVIATCEKPGGAPP